MGFETISEEHQNTAVLILKQSLWDLKQRSNLDEIVRAKDFEAVPMGFKTSKSQEDLEKRAF